MDEFEALGLGGAPASTPEPAQAQTRRELRESAKKRPATKPKRSASPRPAAQSTRPSTSPGPKPRASKPGKAKLGKAKRGKSGASTLLSMAAMLFAGALVVGLSVPANAFLPTVAAKPDTLASKTTTAGQSVAVAESTPLEDTVRSNFTVTSYLELMRAKYGNRNFSYTVGVGAIQWPFPYPVPIGDGYGDRLAPCRGCSTFHKGLDFLPGVGTPIYAIADGVVTMSAVTNSGLGNEVNIEHVIDGVHITSVYGHMKMDSSPLHVGDVVKVGDLVGLTGQTGIAMGPHLHFEIRINGGQTDPWTWMKTHAAS